MIPTSHHPSAKPTRGQVLHRRKPRRQSRSLADSTREGDPSGRKGVRAHHEWEHAGAGGRLRMRAVSGRERER